MCNNKIWIKNKIKIKYFQCFKIFRWIPKTFNYKDLNRKLMPNSLINLISKILIRTLKINYLNNYLCKTNNSKWILIMLNMFQLNLIYIIKPCWINNLFILEIQTKMEHLMAKALWHILMVLFIKDSLWMGKNKVLENLRDKMGLDIKVSGFRTTNMEKGEKHMQTVL